MPNPISALGAIHTLVSLVPLAAGLVGLARHRRIDVRRPSGRVYLAGLTLSVLTTFGLSSTGGFNAGHALGLVALLAAFGGAFAARWQRLGRLRPYLSVFGLSFSFFLLLIPGTKETLTRLPAGHPLAAGLQSPLLIGTLLAWVVLFVIGVVAQGWQIRSRQRAA